MNRERLRGGISMERKKIAFLIFIFLLSKIIFSFAEEEPEVGARMPQFSSSERKIASLSLETSPFTGEASTSFPLYLPPAAGNIQEKIKLSLQYRSGDNNGWLGKGWELEAGYIAKVNKFGANHPNNPYFLTLNGQKEELVFIGNNQYRTKIESHLLIEFDGSTWRIKEKDGTEYKFEKKINGRWSLTKITDIHGICVNLEYDVINGGELYLREISYPEGSGLTPYCKIIFTSENMLDITTTYYYGPSFFVRRRLKEVKILAEGQIQKRYLLNYTTNGTSQASFLSSITEYGKNGQALPTSTFYYQPPLKSSILEPGNEWLPGKETYTFKNGYGSGMGHSPSRLDMAIIDMNGDGLPDLIGCKRKVSSSPPQKYEWVVHLNKKNGFSSEGYIWLDAENSYYSYPVGGLTSYKSITLEDSTLADMNGDNLPDLVYSKRGGSINWYGGITPSFDIMVRYNTGNSFSTNETNVLDYTQTYYIYPDNTRLCQIKIGSNAILADMNGDGLADLVYNKFSGREAWRGARFEVFDWVVRLNTGNGFSSTETIWLTSDKANFRYDTYTGGYQFQNITINKHAILIDMNNDGLPDLLFNDFAKFVTSPDPLFAIFKTISYNWKIRYNTGTCFSDQVNTLYSEAPTYFFKRTHYMGGTTVKIGTNTTVADINSDGLPDILFIRPQAEATPIPIKNCWMVCFNLGNSFAEPVELMDSFGYYLDNGYTYADVVTYNTDLIDMNKDGLVDFVYPKFTQWNSDNGEFKLQVHLNKGAVSTDLLTQYNSILGGRIDIDYTSSDNFDNTGDDDKNDLPLALPVVKKITRNPGIGKVGTTTYNYEGGWYDIPNREFRGFRKVSVTDPLGYTTHTYFHQDDSRLGKIERQENPVVTATNTYQEDNSAPYFTPLIKVKECTNNKCSLVNYEYDSYANVSKTTYEGDIEVSGDGKSILIDYALNPSIWLVNLLSRERVFDENGQQSAETQYYYDNNTNYTDTPAKGDLTKVKRYLNTKNDFIQTTSTYDIYANETSRTDANGNTTYIEYDPVYHSFPTTVTNPLGHIGKNAYYSPTEEKGLFGQLKSKTDPNGNEMVFEYDGFGRRTKVIGPYDLYSTYGSESYEYGLNGPGANYILTRTTEENGTAKHLIKVDILDGFGRMLQSAKESEDENIFSYTATEYNERGEAEKTSLPYFKDGGLSFSYVSPASPQWTNYSYDALGRITLVAKPDGGIINNAYDGWSTTVTDENNHQRILVKDAYDRLISVKERNSPDEYTTNYSYDVLDNLTLITDHLGNKFQFFYDSLRQKTKMIDPDLGTWFYEYDNNGNLIKSTDANSEAISFGYDSLNRLIFKDYLSDEGTEVIYKYDEPSFSNGIGRRTSMQDNSGESHWDYDKEGRSIKLEKKIDSNSYKLEWAYDALDRIKTIILPNNRILNFSYNNAGLAESIDGLINSAEYNASGQAVLFNFANNLTSNFDYYPQNQRLKAIRTFNLQDLNFEYGSTGNITKIYDAVRSYTKNYAYDDLNRLLLGDNNTYEYNAIGNLIKANGTEQKYSLSKAHALINDGMYIYAYDNCGNMFSGAGRIIEYDPENRPIKITKDGTVTEFIYDGDGKRVKKTVKNNGQTVTTIYIEELYEKDF